MRRSRPNYTEDEVRALVAHYLPLTARSGTDTRGLWALVRLADLDRALQQLPRKYREVVLLHGLAGLTEEATATYLGISQQAVAKRFRWGLEEIVFHINGGLT